MSIIPLFQSLTLIVRSYQGRRASRCSALAPSFHIPRLWRSSAPLALIRPLALIALWRSLRFGAHCALALIALWRSLRFGAHRALALTNIIVVKLENRSYDIVLGWVYNPSNEPPHNQAPPGQINLKGLTGNETNPPTQQG